MKKNKFLALVLSAGVVFSLAACGGEQNEEPPATETWTDKQIVDAVMNSSALITSNTGTPMNPVEDYGDTYLNDIHSDNGGYVIASKSYNVISDVGNSYTVPVAWEITSSEKENFLTVKEDGGKNLYTPNWDLTETNDQVKVVLKGTATYNNTTATKNYNLTFIDDQVVIAIEDMKDATDVTVQGYITAFIEGGLYNDKEEWYQVLVQSGDYAFAVAMPYKDKFEDYKVGDAVQVIGTTKFYNGQRQVKNSATVEKLSGAEANAIVKPNTLKVDTVDDFDTTKLLSLASIEGAKVVKVEKIPYKDDEYGQVQAELLLKGKTFYVYADHYNKDYDDKKAFYDKLVEIRDSNGAKTLDMSGVLNNYRRAWVGSGNLGEDEVMAGTPALYLTSSETVTVSDKAYQEVDGINVSYNNEDLFVGETVQLGVTLAGSLVEGGATWTSSDEKIATVDENGLVTGVSAGKVTITATSKTNAEFSASVELECKVRAGQPEFVKASVADVLADDAEDGKQAYVVRGKVAGFGQKKDSLSDDSKDAGVYGNLYLEDLDDSSKVIQVYGLNASFKALSYDAATATYKYSNKQDFQSNPDTAGIKKGDTISVVAIRDEYNGNKQISAILASARDERRTAQEATLQEVIDSTPLGEDSGDTSGQYVFEVTATIKGWGTDGKATTAGEYGNLLVTDGTNDVPVYGMTAQTGKISYNYNGSSKYSIGNPKDFLTNEVTKAFKVGDEITFECVRSDFKGTLQIAADSARLAGQEPGGEDPEPVEPINAPFSLDFTAENVLGNKTSYKDSETVKYNNGEVYLSNGCYNKGDGWVSLTIGSKDEKNFTGLVKDEVAKAIDSTVTADTNEITYNGETAYISSVDFNFDVLNNKGFSFKIIDGKDFNDKKNFVKAFILESTDNSQTWKIAQEIDGTSNTVTYNKDEASKTRYSIVYLTSSKQGRLPIGQVNWLA